jgi:hypothetical protein
LLILRNLKDNRIACLSIDWRLDDQIVIRVMAVDQVLVGRRSHQLLNGEPGGLQVRRRPYPKDLSIGLNPEDVEGWQHKNGEQKVSMMASLPTSGRKAG